MPAFLAASRLLGSDRRASGARLSGGGRRPFAGECLTQGSASQSAAFSSVYGIDKPHSIVYAAHISFKENVIVSFHPKASLGRSL